MQALSERLLHQVFGGTPLNKFGLEGAPLRVVEAQRPLQRGEFGQAQILFGHVAEPANHLFFDMSLFNGAWPDPGEPLELEQFPCQLRLQFFQGFHGLPSPGAEAE